MVKSVLLAATLLCAVTANAFADGFSLKFGQSLDISNLESFTVFGCTNDTNGIRTAVLRIYLYTGAIAIVSIHAGDIWEIEGQGRRVTSISEDCVLHFD